MSKTVPDINESETLFSFHLQLLIFRGEIIKTASFGLQSFAACKFLEDHKTVTIQLQVAEKHV